MATKRDYTAAKKRYESWTTEQHVAPTAEMLADVETINAYERAADIDEQAAASDR